MPAKGRAKGKGKGKPRKKVCDNEGVIIYDDGTIEIVVPHDIIAKSTFPAVLDPVIGPQFQLDDPIAGPSSQNSSLAEIVYDGTNYFAVWSEARIPGYGADIFGARIDPAGNVLDSQGIRISSSTSERTEPSWETDSASPPTEPTTSGGHRWLPEVLAGSSPTRSMTTPRAPKAGTSSGSW